MTDYTKKMRIVVNMANEIVQAKKKYIKTRMNQPLGRITQNNIDLFNEANNLAYEYREKWMAIEKLEPIIKQGRDGGYKGVKVTYPKMGGV